jgi:hypothetical protein
MFSTVRSTPRFGARSRAEAFDAWREAADLVSAQWHLFLEAESGSRAMAFAAYIAALDAEEAAAAGMSALTAPMAA